MQYSCGKWLLPDGVEELVVPESQQLETFRQKILQYCWTWGYDLVLPADMEFVENICTGPAATFLDKTLKVADPLSSKMLGLRVDATHGVARVDARNAIDERPARYCYAGTVFYSNPRFRDGLRTLVQAGAELYGHKGIESDAEIISMMLSVLRELEIKDNIISLGHVGIVRGLIEFGGLDNGLKEPLLQSLQKKARFEVEALLCKAKISPSIIDLFVAMVETSIGKEELLSFRSKLKDTVPLLTESADRLLELVDLLSDSFPEVTIYIDLSQVWGYGYQTGVVFDVGNPACGQAIARGGRYDGMGNVYGFNRPGVGFTTDLQTLIKCSGLNIPESKGVFAMPNVDAALIDTYRREGERVIVELPGQYGSAGEAGCDRQFVKDGDDWMVQDVAMVGK